MNSLTRAIAASGLVLAVGCSSGGMTPADGGPDGARGDGATTTDVSTTGDVTTPVDGSSGDAGGGDSSGPTPMRSAGCGMATTVATGRWVEHSVMVGGASRDYWVWLPAGYDPSRAYPVVYQFHGCSSSPTREDNNVPVERQSGSDAILVRGRAADQCWDTAAGGVDVAYFDALVPAVEGAFCADTAHRFATGYSSGAFMTHQLACIRGSMFRGVATIAGGQGGRSCTGNVAALLIHDLNDGTVNISASQQARDNHAMRNGCDTAAPRTPREPAPCEAYAGCDPARPVVWCQTTGQNHSRQDGLAASAFWGFLSSLSR